MKFFCLHTAIIGEDDIEEELHCILIKHLDFFFPEILYQHRGMLVRKKLRFRKIKLSK